MPPPKAITPPPAPPRTPHPMAVLPELAPEPEEEEPEEEPYKSDQFVNARAWVKARAANARAKFAKVPRPPAPPKAPLRKPHDHMDTLVSAQGEQTTPHLGPRPPKRPPPPQLLGPRQPAYPPPTKKQLTAGEGPTHGSTLHAPGTPPQEQDLPRRPTIYRRFLGRPRAPFAASPTGHGTGRAIQENNGAKAVVNDNMEECEAKAERRRCPGYDHSGCIMESGPFTDGHCCGCCYNMTTLALEGNKLKGKRHGYRCHKRKFRGD